MNNSQVSSNQNLLLGDRKSLADWLRVVLNIVLAAFQPFAPLIVQTAGVNDIATRSAQSPSLFTPPDFTFAIWGIIFLAMLAYGIYQALPSNITNNRLRRIGWWTAIAMALNISWMLQVVATGLTIFSVFIIFTMLAALLIAFFSLYRDNQPSRIEQAVVIFPVSIFAAWITVASLASIPTWLFNAGGFSLKPLPGGVWVAALAIIAGVIATVIMWRNKGNSYYAAVFVWALAGIAIKCAGLGEMLAMLGALVVITVVISAYFKLTKPV